MTAGIQRERISISEAFSENVHPECIPSGCRYQLSAVKTIGNEERPLPDTGVPVIRRSLHAVEEGAVIRERWGGWSQSEKLSSENGSLHSNAENEPHTFTSARFSRRGPWGAPDRSYPCQRAPQKYFFIKNDLVIFLIFLTGCYGP